MAPSYPAFRRCAFAAVVVALISTNVVAEETRALDFTDADRWLVEQGRILINGMSEDYAFGFLEKGFLITHDDGGLTYYVFAIYANELKEVKRGFIMKKSGGNMHTRIAFLRRKPAPITDALASQEFEYENPAENKWLTEAVKIAAFRSRPIVAFCGVKRAWWRALEFNKMHVRAVFTFGDWQLRSRSATAFMVYKKGNRVSSRIDFS